MLLCEVGVLLNVARESERIEIMGDEEEEPEVPEPATYAYAAMGLMSVLGMKRRIRK